MTTLSVVVNVCNEGHLLEDCLKTVSWADEIVVIDMYSQDDSVAVAEAFGAAIYSHPWEPIADCTHTFAFEKATKEWILKLDPDERVSPTLGAQIRQIVTENRPLVAYRLPFKDYIFGRWIKYTGWQGNREVGLVRLFRRGRIKWIPAVHSQPQVQGEVGSIEYDPALDNAIVHLNYSTVEQFIEKLNRYTTAEAQKRLHEGKTFKWPKLFYHPLVAFWRRYVRGKGYRDGMHGLILSVLMAMYADVILVKMWEVTKDQVVETT